MIPGVNVALANGQIGGTTATNDNVTGVVLTGLGTGILALLTPAKVVSVVDAAAQGIGPATEAEAYKFVSEFYSIAGTLGVPVYIMLAVDTATLVSLCDKTNANGIKKLTDFANGTIRVLGVARTPAEDYVPATVEFIDSDVVSAVVNAKAFATDMFAKHTPLRILLAARVNDVTNVTVTSPNTLTANNVGMVIGGTDDSGMTSLGIFLGRVAATQPHVNLGKVLDGDLPINNWYIGPNPILPNPDDATAAWYQQIDQLVDAGYMTVKTYPQKGGYFISNDPMCVAETDDYASLANGRVIDKASIVAYQTYLLQVNNDVDLDDNNLLEPVVIAALDATIKQQLNLNMSASMSGDPVVYTDPSQPILQNSTLSTKLRIRPKGYSKMIDVDLGYYSPTATNA